MHPWFIFIIVSTVSLSICYLAYLAFFRNESRFVQLRSFLLVSMLISLLIPLAPLRIQTGIPDKHQSVQEAISTAGSGIVVNEIPGAIQSEDTTVTNLSHNKLNTALVVIYLSIVLIVLLWNLFQILKIASLYLSSQKRKQGGFTLLTSDKIQAPFSFFFWIFLPTKLSDLDECNKIIAHERIHGNEYHSLDLLLANMLCAMMWFNPLVWRLKYSLQQVHEYLADEGALKTGIDKNNYMVLMLNLAAETRLIPLHSSFNRSLVKNRIIMMTKKSVYRQNRWKILILIPLAALLLLGVACVNGSRDVHNANTDPQSNVVFAVEAVKMNVIYVGVDNPVTIVASGIDQTDLEVSIDNGTIRKEGGNYIINPAHYGTATVNIAADGEKIGSKEFRVKNLETPQPYLVLEENLIQGGEITLADLVKAKGISVVIPNFIFDVKFQVVSFNVNVTEGGITIIEKSDSEMFTDAQKNLIRRLRPGQTCIIGEINAVGPDGIMRELSPMIFQING